MLRGEGNPHPIQLLVNYWEIRPSLMGARLNELLRHGVTHIATFVPWQAVESDITHQLSRFLQAVADRKMTVSLLLTPEVGVHYPNSGLPKDLFKGDHLARHPRGGTIPVMMPPNAYSLPSLSSPEFQKRYQNFLSRLDSLLADLGKSQPRLLENVTAVLTGSFWKYYRAAESSTGEALGSLCGDISGPASLAYRQRLEQHYQAREFCDPTPAAANRWKTRAMEEANRRWFAQHSEDVFRLRSSQFVRRKAGAVELRHYELFTPEADPGFQYSGLLQLITGGRADFARLSDLVEEAASRASHVGDHASPVHVHWTGLGGFQTLSDPEKQFLLLKSLLLTAARGGGILVGEREWFALSASFRSRAESLARLMVQGDLRLANRAFYLAPHLWSGAGTLWDELVARTGHAARLIASMDLALADEEARLLFVDPNFVLTQEQVRKIHRWVRQGSDRVAVLPRGPLYTEAARRELAESLPKASPLAFDLGVSYRVHDHARDAAEGQPALGGKLVTYELPEGLSMHGESANAWKNFVGSMLSLAELRAPCNVSDARLSVLALEKRGEGHGLFILNGSPRPVAGDLVFAEPVAVSDLASAFAKPSADEAAEGSVPADRFALEVPPCGILPVAAEPMRRGATRAAADAAAEPALRTDPRARDESRGAAVGAGVPRGTAGAEAKWN